MLRNLHVTNGKWDMEAEACTTSLEALLPVKKKIYMIGEIASSETGLLLALVLALYSTLATSRVGFVDDGLIWQNCTPSRSRVPQAKSSFLPSELDQENVLDLASGKATISILGLWQGTAVSVVYSS